MTLDKQKVPIINICTGVHGGGGGGEDQFAV